MTREYRLGGWARASVTMFVMHAADGRRWHP